jgi:hypothetical protein
VNGLNGAGDGTIARPSHHQALAQPVYFSQSIDQTARVDRGLFGAEAKEKRMTPQSCTRQHNWLIRTTFIALATLVFANVLLMNTKAAELAEQAHSLKKVPADASFYSANLRFKEQWHLFVGSKAYAKLMEIPLVQMAKMQITFQWQQSEESHIAKFREYIQSPTGQDAVAILKEMFSDETYLYGGADIAESLKLFMEMNSVRRTSQFPIRAEGTTGEEKQEQDSAKNRGEASINRAIEILDKHSDTFKVPTVVIGFRIKDKARAKRELDEVHSLIRNLLDQAQPDLAAHLQRDQIAGNEFLALRLDGSMLPWEKIHEEADSLNDEQFEKLKNFFSKQKLAVALGVTDEFVILSIGQSTDHLEKVGQGSVLADAPAIKRLEKHADQRVVGIQYVSKMFAKSLGSANQTMENIATAAGQALEQAKVNEEQRKQVIEDIRGLNLARYMPEPGDTSAVAFLTERGYEGFQYTDGKRPMADSSKPLTILSHAGGSPLLLVASRSKQNIQDYEAAITWLKKTAAHLEKIAEEKSKPEQWAKYREIRKRAVVLLERLDKANREHLYPALADGQGAFVLDLEAKSKQWFKKMPESPKALPMLELAFVASVSDAERLRQGVAAYIDVAVETYKLIKEYSPKEMPELKLPKATVSELSGGGKLYSYPLPKQWGVDPQVAVNAGLTDKFVAVSTMPKTTERLLNETTPDLDTSLKLDRPAAMVLHVGFAKMIHAIEPWIDYGIDVASGKLKVRKEGEDDEEKAQANPAMLQLGFVVPQVHQFLEFACALRSVTAISYEEEGEWVMHSETHIQDLK